MGFTAGRRLLMHLAGLGAALTLVGCGLSSSVEKVKLHIPEAKRFGYVPVAATSAGPVIAETYWPKHDGIGFRTVKIGRGKEGAMDSPWYFKPDDGVERFGIVIVDLNTDDSRVFWIERDQLPRVIDQEELALPEYGTLEAFDWSTVR